MTLEIKYTSKHPTQNESVRQIDNIILNMVELRNLNINVNDIKVSTLKRRYKEETVGDLFSFVDKVCREVLSNAKEIVEQEPIKDKTQDTEEDMKEKLEVKKVTLDRESKNPPKLIISNGIELTCGRDRIWSTSNIDNPIKIPDEDLEIFETLEDLVTHILTGINLHKKKYTEQESEILQEWLVESDKYYKVQLSGKLLRGNGNIII